jgi:hypothetical protein
MRGFDGLDTVPEPDPEKESVHAKTKILVMPSAKP